MSVNLNPYLNFRDKTRDAMTFYHTVFGGKVEMNTFEEFHASPDESENNKIMHSVLNGDNGIVFMAADTPNSMEYKPGTNMNMSLSGDSAELLKGYYDKLCDGGTVTMPMNKAPWGDEFGMCVDKFGVAWLVNISPAEAPAEA